MGERACNTAATGCNACWDGYAYDGAKAYCEVQPAAPGTHPTWMGDIDSYIANTSLNRVVIPGTHDAGTYSASGLAQAQDQSLSQQLDGGIRHFDLRPCLTSSTTGGKDPKVITSLSICHGIAQVNDMQAVLTDVHNWISTHPKEIVILDMQNSGESDGTALDQASVAKLMGMISTTFAGCLPDHTTITPASTVSQIRAAKDPTGKARSSGTVVVGWWGESSAIKGWLGPYTKYIWIDGTNRRGGSWANTTSRTTAKSDWAAVVTEGLYPTTLLPSQS